MSENKYSILSEALRSEPPPFMLRYAVTNLYGGDVLFSDGKILHDEGGFIFNPDECMPPDLPLPSVEEVIAGEGAGLGWPTRTAGQGRRCDSAKPRCVCPVCRNE